MATAEVRAVWQRAVNRCFVQEDAKRAPKLAYCQSSCATSKLFDFGAASAADESDHAAVNVTLFNPKSLFSSGAPDSRWWLQLQPNYEAYSESSQANSQLVDMMAKHETMDIDSVCCSLSKRTNDSSLDSEYSWIGVEKAEPWWQTRDRDELASFVSHKSLNHIENCDLPPPQKYLTGQPCPDIGNINIRRTSSLDREAFSNFNVQAKESVESGLMHRMLGPSTNKRNLYFDCDKYSSYSTIHGGVTEQVIGEDPPSKAQLMEALCHSQTRARQAEERAKQACAEKKHIIALFFLQASQLFAYKQWFQLLQLENLNTQLKNKDQPTLFPVALPWIGRKFGKRKQKLGNVKQKMLGKPKSDITTYAIAFALGLSLVGAGLLLGWTVGCMLPCS
ncbi:unnamed protein product [Sphenostylis stenocarpa]|uniref:Uncharacterized protein n=1 Tax=Sphenostylis stenocarpa TaxID=92480 RepID=A0AA86SB60_9FABA|nr:unnamed protein product [Sphenostylis stenocarpa]